MENEHIFKLISPGFARRLAVLLHEEVIRTDATVVKDSWSHLTIIWKQPQNQTHLFVNGDKYSKYETALYSFGPPKGGAMVIGRQHVDLDARYSSLTVDEVVIWNVVLPDDEVRLMAQRTDG